MRIAVLGLGFMGSTHLKGWSKLEGAELVAVASDEAARLSGDLSQVEGNLGGGPGGRYDFTGVARYERWQEAVADPRVEAVDICLPTNLHAPAALAALAAGEHVLVEKPMALAGVQARAMVAEAQRRGLVLMTAQVLRFLPMYRRLREQVAGGGLGAIRAAFFRRSCAAPAWSRWLADAAASGGGVFDLLIHDVDMCVHLFGKPLAVRATGHVDLARGRDWILAQFLYPAAGPGTVVVTGGWHPSAAYPFSMEYSVMGDQGTLEFSSAGRPPTLYRAGGGGGAASEVLEMEGVDGYDAEVEYFFECCRAGRTPELCPPEESALAVELAQAMLESRRRNGEEIACP